MTRGTIACVKYLPDVDVYLLFKSIEFNGDMKPDMYCGKKLLDFFKQIYFNKNNHSSKMEKIFSILKKMCKMFRYNIASANTMNVFEIKRNADGKFALDISDEKNLRKYFNYSDYEYVTNISYRKNVPEFYVVKNGRETSITKDIAVFNYGDYCGFYNPTDDFCSEISDEVEDEAEVESNEACQDRLS